MEHYRFSAYLDSFTGMDDTSEDNSFRRIYSEAVSLARGAGSNLSRPEFVYIYDAENSNLPVCAIGNIYGAITLSTPNNATVLRMPEVRA